MENSILVSEEEEQDVQDGNFTLYTGKVLEMRGTAVNRAFKTIKPCIRSMEPKENE